MTSLITLPRSPAGLADRQQIFLALRAHCQPAGAASQLRDSPNEKGSRSADRPYHPRGCGHFDNLDIYPRHPEDSHQKLYRHHLRASARHLHLKLGLAPLMAGQVICTQCQTPVCDESKCLCSRHLQLVNEAVTRSNRGRGVKPWPPGGPSRGANGRWLRRA